MLERPTQLEVARLLLQGRSSTNSAAAMEVDGLDCEFRASKRDPGIVVLVRHFDRSIDHRESQWSREWYPANDWSRLHHRLDFNVRLFVFTHGIMRLVFMPDRLMEHAA
ncbi:MAG: hypothetical protein ABSE48_07545 [Verrucomicrobiota bacterium]